MALLRRLGPYSVLRVPPSAFAGILTQRAQQIREKALAALDAAERHEAKWEKWQHPNHSEAAERERDMAAAIEDEAAAIELSAEAEAGGVFLSVGGDSSDLRFSIDEVMASAFDSLTDDDALLIASEGQKHWWAVGQQAFETTDEALTPDDVVALAGEAANRRRLQLQKAHALRAMTQELAPRVQRDPISQDVKVTVWQRDGGRCVECGSNENLEFDHIIPLAMGGANTMRNLQLLCETCNRRKGASLG